MGNGLRWTEEELAQAVKVGRAGNRGPRTAAEKAQDLPPRPTAKGALKPRKMNKTEAAYGDVLKARPDVIWCEFEGITLRLGDDCRYTPDWALMLRDGAIELHETKGFMREDALVKIKTAANRYPFRFVLVRKEKSGWTHMEIRP